MILTNHLTLVIVDPGYPLRDFQTTLQRRLRAGALELDYYGTANDHRLLLARSGRESIGGRVV